MYFSNYKPRKLMIERMTNKKIKKIQVNNYIAYKLVRTVWKIIGEKN